MYVALFIAIIKVGEKYESYLLEGMKILCIDLPSS